jgi:hypothetical protein
MQAEKVDDAKRVAEAERKLKRKYADLEAETKLWRCKSEALQADVSEANKKLSSAKAELLSVKEELAYAKAEIASAKSDMASKAGAGAVDAAWAQLCGSAGTLCATDLHTPTPLTKGFWDAQVLRWHWDKFSVNFRSRLPSEPAQLYALQKRVDSSLIALKDLRDFALKDLRDKHPLNGR